MNNPFFRVSIFLVFAGLSSCIAPASVLVNSQTLGRVEVFPQKVFLLSFDSQGMPDEFHDGYIKAMASEFKKLGTAAGIARVTGLELNKNFYARQIEEFQPELVMIMNFELVDTFDGILRGSVHISLIKHRNAREVWRSLQTFRFEDYTEKKTSNAGAQFAQEVFQKLIRDPVFMPQDPKPKKSKGSGLGKET